LLIVRTEIIMVWLQGDFAKPPEKRFNYKNCFDALFRVCLHLPCLHPLVSPIFVFYIDVEFRAQMAREEGPSSLARGIGPNVFRAILMNATQLASCVLPLSLSLFLSFPLSPSRLIASQLSLLFTRSTNNRFTADTISSKLSCSR
jgi:hypothetical protein